LIVIAQIFLTLTRTFTQVIREGILMHLSIRVSVSMISDFIDKLLRLPLSYFGSKSIGDFTQRIYDHSRIEDFISNHAFSIFFDAFSIIVLAAILAYFDVNIFMVFAIGSLIFIGWSLIFLKRKAFIDHEIFNLNRLNHSLIIQMISAVREIKLNGSFLRRKRDWKDVQAQLFNTQTKMLRVDQSQINGGLFLKELTGDLIIFISAKSVVDGNMTLGTMLAIQFIIGSLSIPISNIVHFVVEFQKANLSFKRLAEIHTQPIEKMVERKVYNFENGSIDIENVQFGYGEKAISPILQNLSFSIPLKKTTALVGGSGAGKSTLLKLLLKLYEPQKGQIKINDENLQNISTDYWRSLCGVVLQDGILFNDTIERNITESQSQLPTNYESLNQALIISNMLEFVESLPLGIQTVIGENGSFLSGGQKQRLMIARAIYKNPEFLFFDEATSSLDAENEKMITENLISLQKNKTVLVIAHRLSTVKNADQILVMENGQIIESGTHVELLRHRGYYHQLIHNQLN
jgi:ATP-binding cassette subfamily B protein